MKFPKKILLALFLLFVVAILFVIVQLKQESSDLSVKKISDQLAVILRSELDKEKESALRYALVLSKNHALIEAMENDDEDKGYLILSELMHSIKQYTHTLIRTQIITDDYLIFARSWDNTFAGMPIDEYRPDLRYFQQNKKPRSAIEVGRRLGIKATVPIFNDGKMLGFVEVLQFFENTTDYFRKMGVELYILMDERFYNIAILMQDNPFIGSRYVVANRHYNTAHLSDLEAIDFKRLQQRDVVRYNQKYFFYEPMINGSGEKIGAFVMVLPEQRLKHFASREDELSFMLNFTRSELYEITKKQYDDEAGYKSRYDKEILYLKDVVDEEDRELFVDEARERLGEYSKEELIGMILNYDISHEIKGEIR
jgi:hypothetical protein